MLSEIIRADSSKITIRMRSTVAVVFLSGGIQKFLIAAMRAAGRLGKIGLRLPEIIDCAPAEAAGFAADGTWEMLRGTLAGLKMRSGRVFLLPKDRGRATMDKILPRNGA